MKHILLAFLASATATTAFAQTLYSQNGGFESGPAICGAPLIPTPYFLNLGYVDYWTGVNGVSGAVNRPRVFDATQSCPLGSFPASHFPRTADRSINILSAYNANTPPAYTNDERAQNTLTAALPGHGTDNTYLGGDARMYQICVNIGGVPAYNLTGTFQVALRSRGNAGIDRVVLEAPVPTTVHYTGYFSWFRINASEDEVYDYAELRLKRDLQESGEAGVFVDEFYLWDIDALGHGVNCGFPEDGQRKVLNFSTNKLPEQNINIWPTITSTDVNVALPGNADMTKTEVVVSDLQGKILHVGKPTSILYKVDVSNYASGMYIVRVKSGSLSSTAKVVKQ